MLTKEVDNKKWKHIVVSMDNYRWLKTLGQTSDSFNDVIAVFRREKGEARRRRK
jgi:predicted CopG family antitoxin